ncbi:aromatic acid exporter family protein [Domibacillus sp. 8LH]|uniref:aromatic acid exporter family protein n=1 Tax=Domibacillus sp. 8LH TaxID=3073900 RepID=UPI003176788F
MSFKIGFRTVKTAVAVSAAIAAAGFLQLEFYVSSAIITILCVQHSRQKSLQSARDRFFACMLSIPFSFVFFEGFGYHPPVIGALLLVFIPLTVMLKINEGIVTSTVILLHIYAFGHMTAAVVLNEIGLVVIGISAALLANLYMPGLERQLALQKETIEARFKHLLIDVVLSLRDGNPCWKEADLFHTDHLIKEAQKLAAREQENHFGRSDDSFCAYFNQAEQKLAALRRFLDVVPLHESNEELADWIESFSYGSEIKDGKPPQSARLLLAIWEMNQFMGQHPR